jgi:hypothetical protein
MDPEFLVNAGFVYDKSAPAAVLGDMICRVLYTTVTLLRYLKQKIYIDSDDLNFIIIS